MKPNMLIIFGEPHIRYSPTILNLIKRLEKNFNIFLTLQKSSINENFDLNNVHMLRFPTQPENQVYKFSLILFKMLDVFMYRAIRRRFFCSFLKMIMLSKFVKSEIIRKGVEINLVLGVEAIGACVAMSLYKKCHLLSLEMFEYDLMRRLLSLQRKKVESLMVPSKELEKILINKYQGRKFYVQNAPFHKKISKNKIEKNKFIFLGSFIPKMGSNVLLEFAKRYPNFTLVIKGLIPEEIKKIKSVNILIDNKYLEQREIQLFLSTYEIGFCVYDFSVIPKDEHSHVRNVPSGKMYSYFNALVPCIGNKCAGLLPIEKFGAGILLDDISPESINQAVIKIKKNYSSYVKGCKKAAEFYDFKKMSSNYISYLKREGKNTIDS